MKLLREVDEIPVIFITANKQPGLKKRAAELGVAAFFEKPFDSTELIAKINEILR